MSNMARIRTQWSGGLSAGSLSTHYFGTFSSTPPAADIQACIDRVRDFWAALITHIQIGFTWTIDAQVDFINDVDGVLTGGSSYTSRTGQGTLTGDPLPPQTQGLVRWNTNTVADGHRLRGHTYIPAPMEVDNTSGAPIAAYVTALNTAAAALAVTGALVPVVWHRPVYSSAGVLVRNGTSGTITGGSGQGSWSVLRSRR